MFFEESLRRESSSGLSAYNQLASVMLARIDPVELITTTSIEYSVL